MTNPFQQAPAPAPQQPPAQQPMISDAAAQQFVPQQAAPNAFQQMAQGIDHAAQLAAQGQHPVQQAYAQQAPAQPQQFAPSPQAPNGELHTQAHGFAPAQPQGLPGQPWTPQQHQQTVPQAYAPPVAPPVQQQAPAPASQGLPRAPFPGQQGQMPGHAGPGPHMPAGGGFDPSMFGAPSQGGGTFPKVRDLDGRLCLFRVKDRNKKGTAYKSTAETINYVVNVAVLDGGPLWSSPADDQPMAQAELVTETLPYVVGDMTIGPKGLQNRLKADFVRGRVVRMPMGEFEKDLLGAFPGMEGWQALATWIAQAPGNINLLAAGTYFWGIIEDTSPQADQLIAAFAQHPIARELML